MLRKTVLGAAAGVTLALAAIAPTSASAHSFGIHIGGGPYWGGGYGFGWGGPYCTFKKVKVWSHFHGHFIWKTKKFCY